VLGPLVFFQILKEQPPILEGTLIRSNGLNTRFEERLFEVKKLFLKKHYLRKSRTSR